MDYRALEIIDMLYSMISEAWGVPLGNDKCIIERDKAMGLLDDLKALLPTELTEARRLVFHRDEFVNSARKEAESIRSEAENAARAMIDKESVLLAARQQVDDLMQDTKTRTRMLKDNVSSEIDVALRETEEAIAASLSAVREQRARFRAAFSQVPEGTADVSMDDVTGMDIMEE